MFSIKKEYEKCWHCENFYGPCFGEPLCMTCHLFLYPANTIEDESISSGSCSRLAHNSGTSRSNILMTTGSVSTSSSATNGSTSSTLNSDTIGPNMNRIRNIVEKLELNDSGNEDTDPDPLNLEQTSSETETASSTFLAHLTSQNINNIGTDNNSTIENDANINLNDEDDEEENEKETSKRRRFLQRRRTTSNNTVTYTNNNSVGSNYYTIQYSRKQLDNLARNAVRLNNNNNYHRYNNNNYNNDRQTNVDIQKGSAKSGRCLSSSSRISLKQQLMMLSTFNETNKCETMTPNSDFINILPNEVLWNIFSKLDDLALWSVSRVCKRWYELVRQEISEDEWKMFISNRWIFFRPAVKIRSYQALYSQLIQSSNCFYCLQFIHNRSDTSCNEEVKKSWRHKRLLLELKALNQDPMPGINARPLDASCFYWQASITGPVGSPYEGGVFYLFLKIPPSYPLNPPLVQFITKIYHPNISKHGDIGLDSIHENWSLALTISKVLISIQSLLTDPYTKVCMENEIGRIYNTNREIYERNARFFTWKYAMSDYVQFDEYNQINNFLDHTST